jgi:pantothenate kinase
MKAKPARHPLADRDGLIERANRLAVTGQRRILGIAGPPGAGKSTLAEQVVDALAPDAVLVAMDGFHLAQSQLQRLGRHDRKGAPDTFDAAGFVALMRRLRANGEEPIYAPTFRRDLEEPIAGSIAVPSGVPLVVTEGNYLLVAERPWAQLRDLIDEVWYLEPPEALRLERLVRRHMDFGRDARTAKRRALGSDQRNADLIRVTRDRADLIVVG